MVNSSKNSPVSQGTGIPALIRLCSTLPERAIVFFLHDHGPCTLEDIASGTSMAQFNARGSLLILQSRGAVDIIRVKTSKNGKKLSKVYWILTDDKKRRSEKKRIKADISAKFNCNPGIKMNAAEIRHPVNKDLDCTVKCPLCGIDITLSISKEEFNSYVDDSGLLKKASSHDNRHYIVIHVNREGKVIKTYGYECKTIIPDTIHKVDKNVTKPEKDPANEALNKIAEESSGNQDAIPVEIPEKKPITADIQDILKEMMQFL
ncbi:MAG: hypothetical protein ACFFD4_31675 [Candidatus Odinarchaeota archaeon]